MTVPTTMMALRAHARPASGWLRQQAEVMPEWQKRLLLRRLAFSARARS